MKDENIKEILDRAKNLKYKCDCCVEIAPGKYMMRNDKQTDNLIEAVYIIDRLLDYITNLQIIEQQYSAILSENAELENKITNLQEENKRLKNGYCELKVKCNNGECDCTNEEYEDMVQANIKGSLLLEDYKSRNEKAIELLKYDIENFDLEDGYSTCEKALIILQGEDKE